MLSNTLRATVRGTQRTCSLNANRCAPYTYVHAPYLDRDRPAQGCTGIRMVGVAVLIVAPTRTVVHLKCTCRLPSDTVHTGPRSCRLSESLGFEEAAFFSYQQN